MKKIFNYIKKYSNKFDSELIDRLDLHSTEAAFYAIISAVPFIMFFLTLLRYIIPIDYTQLHTLLSAHLPKSLSFWVEKIISSTYTDSTISLTSITAITCIWGASRSLYAISKGLRMIYDNKQESNMLFVRIFSIIFTLLMISAFALALLLIVFSEQLLLILNQHRWILLTAILSSSFVATLIFIVSTTLLFTIAYKHLSYSRLPYKEHFPGAILTSVTWLLFSRLYYIYINFFPSFSITYGSLAAIVLMMWWLKSCMTILLLGALVNVEIADNKGHIRHTK